MVVRKISLLIISAGASVFLCAGFSWATLIDLNNGVTLDDRNTSSVADDGYWIQNLDMFTGLTYDEQIAAINNLSVAGLENVSWRMATYSDLLSLEALYPFTHSSAEITDAFIPNGFSPGPGPGTLPHWAGRYDRVFVSSNPNPPYTYHYEVNMWTKIDPTYGEISSWGLGVGIADFEVGVGAFVVGNAASVPVPEPATIILFGAGIGGLAVARLRRSK